MCSGVQMEHIKASYSDSESDDDASSSFNFNDTSATQGDSTKLRNDITVQAKQNYLGLDSSEESSDEGDLSDALKHKHGKSKFWSGKYAENWDNPSAIWEDTPENLSGNTSELEPNKSQTSTSVIATRNATDHLVNKNVHGNMNKVSVYGNKHCMEEIIAYQPKKMRKAVSTDEKGCTDMNTRNIIAETSRKSFYFVHHKVSKFLHTRPVCKPPRSKCCDLSGHAGPVNRLVWCPRTEYSHLLASCSMDATVKVWNAFSSTTTECVQSINTHQKAVKDVKWHPSGQQLLSCGFDRMARLTDVERGTEIQCFDHENYVTCVSYHPVNSYWFVTGSLDKLYAWDQRSGSKPFRTYTYKDTFNQVADVMFVPDGKTFFTCNDLVTRESSDRGIMAWDFASTVVISNQIYLERYTCTRLVMHPHKAEFAAQSQGDYIALFSTTKPFKMNKCKRYDSHKVTGYSIGCDISPDGQYIISGSSDGHLFCYDYERTKTVAKLNTGLGTCLSVDWHPVLYSTVAVGGWTGKMSVWQ